MKAEEGALDDVNIDMEKSMPTLTDFVKSETVVDALTTGVSAHKNRSNEVRRKTAGCSLRIFLKLTAIRGNCRNSSRH